MASYPPPYPPPPLGLDPRQQRRIFKDQARAQKNAFRAQRELYRQQSRLMRQGSILGPLLIVALGVVLLALHSGHVSFERFASWYGHWWPVLLVGAGVILVLEWTFDQVRHREGAPYVRRGIGSGVVFLLILLGLAGGLLSQISRGHEWLDSMHIGPDNIDELLGEKHERQSQLDSAFTAGGSLSISNPHGDITILGRSDDNQIHLTLNKQIYSGSDSSADAKAEQLSPKLVQNGTALSITVPAINGASADVSVTLPDSGQITVSASHGDIHVSGMRAPVNASANFGDIEINQVSGPVIAHMNRSSSSFSAHNITGDVALKGHADNLTITDVTGQVSIDGEFYGDTHLEHLAGPVSFKTSRTQWTLARLDGAVDMSSDSELTASQIVGPTVLITRSRNISFDRVLGDVSVTNSNGTVDINDAAPLGNVTVQNRDGAVNLMLPEHAGFTLTAENRDGEIENDFALPSSTSKDNATLTGTIGDGRAKIYLKTTHADLGIHKGDVVPPAPLAPSAIPTPPAPPAPHTVKPRKASPAEPAKNVDF